MLKETLLLARVSVTGTLKVRVFIRFQVLLSSALEPENTTSLSQDVSRTVIERRKANKYLLIPFIIKSPVFLPVLVPVGILLVFGRIEPCKAVILEEILRNGL